MIKEEATHNILYNLAPANEYWIDETEKRIKSFQNTSTNK